ncbi:MAG: hypothetical protein P4N41_20745 [Negativicutes bacterium]|nr:hypothetical protein [Negativicutes bacterium]
MQGMNDHDIYVGAAIAAVAGLAVVGRLLDSPVYWSALWYIGEFLGWYVLLYYLTPVVAKKAAKSTVALQRRKMAYQCTLGLVLFDLLLRRS